MILHIMKSIELTFLLALELSLGSPLNRRTTFKTRNWCSTCEEYEQYAYKCPL